MFVSLTNSMSDRAGAFTSTASLNVNIVYQEMNGRELVESIRQVSKPEVIFWYIGVYGLRKNGVSYYRKDLSKLLQSTDASCQLYDLTAWAPFGSGSKEGTIEGCNPNADAINRFAIPRIQCRKSCDFFDWLQSVKPGKSMEDLKQILRRPRIYQLSAGFPDSSQNIGDVFRRNCPLLEEIYEKPASKCYSALQYLEGMYLIKTLVNDALEKDPASQEINLIFALPNNESLYYRDEADHLSKDAASLLESDFGDRLKGKTVNLSFYSFRYGDGGRNRPYNAGANNIENLKTADEIVQFTG